MQFVFGQLEFADRREVFDWDAGKVQIASRSYDHEFLSCSGSGGSHLPNCCRHAIDVIERVSEPGAFAILQRKRDFAGQLLKNSPQPFSRGRLAVKAVDVWRQDNQDRRDCAESLHALHHIAAADLLNKFVEEAKRELLGDHVRHEKCAPLRFAHLVQLRGQFRFHVRPREITGKLFPQRYVCGLDEFENFSR